MAENSKIEWTHHTFNPWTGCTAISPACDHCYAEGWAKRSGHVQWGPHGERRRTKTWGNPVKWNKKAGELGVRFRVFCASLADVFDNHKSIEDSWRRDLWTMIEDTPNLDWLLLTKRPQNIQRFIPAKWREEGWPDNVWLGTTVENQDEAEKRIPHLLRLNAKVRFLSCEPLVGPLDLRNIKLSGRDAEYWLDALGGTHSERAVPPTLHWIISGGESGNNYRESNPNWFRSLRDQCAATNVPFLFKQWDGRTQSEIKAKGRELDGVIHDGYPKVL